LSLNKKVTKEVSIGEALMPCSPINPTRAHSATALHLIGVPASLVCPNVGGGSALAALPIFHHTSLQGKNRYIFALLRM
jgi:hypothetical protein